MTPGTNTLHTGFPPIAAGTLGRAFMAGLAGLLVWEAFARLAAPLWIGGPLDATALIQMSLGVSGEPAMLLHLLTGVLFYPLGYLFILRPLALRLRPGAGWVALGLIYGVGLWVFAMFVMASLVGGAPAFLGFQPVAWASLIGHLAMAITIAGVSAMLRAGEA
jgi:hypothetical protein